MRPLPLHTTTLLAPSAKLMKLWDLCMKDIFLKQRYEPRLTYFPLNVIVFSFKSPVREYFECSDTFNIIFHWRIF